LTGDAACRECAQAHYAFSQVFALGPYEGIWRNAVLHTKYPDGYPLAVALGRYLAETNESEIRLFHPDLILPIPLHWSRRLKRGTNGPDALAKSMSKYFKIPWANRLLIRIRRTLPQTNLSQAQRRKNLQGAFRVSLRKGITGKRILLVDDVLTTGATGNEAAKMLQAGGATKVALAVVARAGMETARRTSPIA